MPLVRISLREGKTEEYKKALGDGVHRAMVEAIEAPAQDRFQIITEHPAGGLLYDPTYLGIQRTENIVMVPRFWRKILDYDRRISWSVWWKWRGRTGRLATAKRNIPFS
jgi:phenylpyruvate tautomerase PptA (4-oxalocrotonate tautomerase family)